jgi:hypothetical protein
MAFPSMASMQSTTGRLPVVTSDDLDAALLAANLRLPISKQERFHQELAVAFRNYFVNRLWDLWSAKSPASYGAAKIGRLDSAVSKVIRILELQPNGSGAVRQQGRLDELYRLILTAQANLYGEEIGGFPGLEPREFVAAESPRRQFGATDFRGDEALGQFLDSLELWSIILNRAHAYERKKVSGKGDTKRRERNQPLHLLFCTINSAWEDAFEKLPADGWNAYAGRADGPYIRFMESILHTMAGKIDPETDREYPKLAKDLRLTRNGIRGRFRLTGEAKLPALVKRLMAKPAKKK